MRGDALVDGEVGIEPHRHEIAAAERQIGIGPLGPGRDHQRAIGVPVEPAAGEGHRTIVEDSQEQRTRADRMIGQVGVDIIEPGARRIVLRLGGEGLEGDGVEPVRRIGEARHIAQREIVGVRQDVGVMLVGIGLRQMPILIIGDRGHDDRHVVGLEPAHEHDPDVIRIVGRILRRIG